MQGRLTIDISDFAGSVYSGRKVVFQSFRPVQFSLAITNFTVLVYLLSSPGHSC